MCAIQKLIISDFFKFRKIAFEVANAVSKDTYKWTVGDYVCNATQCVFFSTSSNPLELGCVDGGEDVDKDESKNEHSYTFDMNLTFFPPSLIQKNQENAHCEEQNEIVLKYRMLPKTKIDKLKWPLSVNMSYVIQHPQFRTWDLSYKQMSLFLNLLHR